MSKAYESVLINTDLGVPVAAQPRRKKAKQKAKANGGSKLPYIPKRHPKNEIDEAPKLVEFGGVLRLDPAKRADRVMRFIEAHCGLRLAPWQIDLLQEMYETNPKTGKLIRNRTILSTGRKNGKTALAAALALCHCGGSEGMVRDAWRLSDGLPTRTQNGDQILVAANSKAQATNLFNAAREMVFANKALKSRMDVVPSTVRIVHKNRLNWIECMTNNSRTAQGSKPAAWFYDELGSSRDMRMYEALNLAQGTIDDPFGFVFSTNSDMPGQPLFDLCEAVRKGQANGEHKEYVLRVYAADPKDDPWKKKTILKANPAIGYFAHWDYYRKERDLAKRMPAKRSAYEAFILNRRFGVKDVLVNVFDWQACADQSLSIAEFEGRECVIGLDLSLRKSMTAVTLAFPPEEKDGDWCLFSECWLPHDTLQELQEFHRTPYLAWVEKGLLNTTSGKTLDLEPIADYLQAATEMFDVKSIRCDQHRYPEFERLLSDKGLELPMEHFSPKPFTMGPATERFTNLIAAGKLKHDDSPAANFCVANTVAVNKLMAGEHLVVPGKTQLGTTPAFLPNDACITMILALAVTKPPEEKPEPDTAFVSLKAELARLENGDA